MQGVSAKSQGRKNLQVGGADVWSGTFPDASAIGEKELATDSTELATVHAYG